MRALFATQDLSQTYNHVLQLIVKRYKLWRCGESNSGHGNDKSYVATYSHHTMKQDLSICEDGGLLVLREEKSSMYLRIHLRFFFSAGRRIPSILTAPKVLFHSVMTIAIPTA